MKRRNLAPVACRSPYKKRNMTRLRFSISLYEKIDWKRRSKWEGEKKISRTKNKSCARMCTISFTILLSRSQSRGFTHFSQFILLFALMSRNIIGQQQQQCLFDVCMVQKLCATACDTRSHDCTRMRRISIAIFAQIFIFSISENPNRFNNFFRLFISCLSSFTQFVSLSDFFHVFFLNPFSIRFGAVLTQMRVCHRRPWSRSSLSFSPHFRCVRIGVYKSICLLTKCRIIYVNGFFGVASGATFSFDIFINTVASPICDSTEIRVSALLWRQCEFVKRQRLFIVATARQNAINTFTQNKQMMNEKAEKRRLRKTQHQSHDTRESTDSDKRKRPTDHRRLDLLSSRVRVVIPAHD